MINSRQQCLQKAYTHLTQTSWNTICLLMWMVIWSNSSKRCKYKYEGRRTRGFYLGYPDCHHARFLIDWRSSCSRWCLCMFDFLRVWYFYHSTILFQRQTAERNTIPAFVYGVSSLEGEIYFTAGGNRVVNDSSSGPIDPDTVFWICSMTKMLGHVSAKAFDRILKIC